MKTKKFSLGIVGGGPKSWIGHVHRISARFDNKYEIVAGVFSRNSKLSINFGKKLGIQKDRCYSNFIEMANKESKSCLLYTSPSPRDVEESRMASSA